MNQEKLMERIPPCIPALLSVVAVPPMKNSSKSIEKAAIDEFLYVSRLYLGLDNNS